MPDPDSTWPPEVSLDDAPLPYDELEARCALTDRWPDWRTLCQTDHWITPDADVVPLTDIDGPGLEHLLRSLRSMATHLHVQAAMDEQFALSSAARWAYAELGVPLTFDLHPLAWLEATPLVRRVVRDIDLLLNGE